LLGHELRRKTRGKAGSADRRTEVDERRCVRKEASCRSLGSGKCSNKSGSKYLQRNNVLGSTVSVSDDSKQLDTDNATLRRRSRAERSSHYKDDSLPITNLVLVDHSQTPISLRTSNPMMFQVEPFVESAATTSGTSPYAIIPSTETVENNKAAASPPTNPMTQAPRTQVPRTPT